MNPLTEMVAGACEDLEPHAGEFDAVVTAGDFHGAALGAVIASVFDKPLMLVCRRQDIPTQSLIVSIGECQPGHRYLYVDDYFVMGNSLRRVFDYLDSSGTPAPVVATYEVTTRTWRETGRVVPPS